MLPKYTVYFVELGEWVCFGLSPDPAFDWHHWQSRGASAPPKPLSSPLPLFAACRLLSNLTNSPFSPQKLNFFTKLRLHLLSRKVARGKLKVPASPLPFLTDAAELEELLSGKLYLWEELQRLWPGGDLPLGVQQLVLEGKCRLAPAVGLDSWGRLICRRCGSAKLQANSWCCEGEVCFECTECSSLGKASTCTGIVAMARRQNDPSRYVELKLSFPLTEAQRRASAQLVEFVKEPSSQSCLLWAVCGAGKTEVAYQAAKIVLAGGGRVLFAIPRRSVVQELAERLRQAFSGLPIQALYGGAAPDERRRTAPLVVATTHQALRFYRNFDLVILDEVDAFPYRGSEALQRGTERALRQGGKRIFMTATPDRQLFKKAKAEKWSVVRLPVRHHGHPLPVPEVVLGPFSADPLRIPKQVLALIKSSQRLFVFVPTIALCLKVSEALKGKGIQAAFCHAQDPRRQEKLLAFRDGKIRCLVATTVAERGLTVPGADVLVLFADHRLFDERALVQMAGRCGRTASHPTGRVYFAAAARSPAMDEAVRQIKAQNREAERLGLLAAA